MNKRIVSIIASSLIFAVPVFAENSEEFSKSMDAYLQNDQNVEKIFSAVERVHRKKQEDMRKSMEEEQASKLEEQFKNPVKIEVGQAPLKGPANAKVTIVEFSDFQCPFCKRGASIVEDVLKAYPNEVKLYFKHLPLSFHENAKPAAIASLAAHKQGKFWEMHDKLFQNQSNLSEQSIQQYAKEIGLNMDKFQSDIKDEAIAKQVDADTELGQSLGVQGTPGFFVNGVLLSGAQPLPKFKEVIDRWLATKGAPAQAPSASKK